MMMKKNKDDKRMKECHEIKNMTMKEESIGRRLGNGSRCRRYDYRLR